MQVDLSSLVGVIGGLAGLAVLLGGVLVFFRGAYNKARIDALRQDLQDAVNRDKRREQEHAEDVQRMEKLEQRVLHLDTENQMLRDLVTQRISIEELGTLLTTHHREAMDFWAEMRDIWRAIKEEGHHDGST